MTAPKLTNVKPNSNYTKKIYISLVIPAPWIFFLHSPLFKIFWKSCFNCLLCDLRPFQFMIQWHSVSGVDMSHSSDKYVWSALSEGRTFCSFRTKGGGAMTACTLISVLSQAWVSFSYPTLHWVRSTFSGFSLNLGGPASNTFSVLRWQHSPAAPSVEEQRCHPGLISRLDYKHLPLSMT